MWQYFWQDVCIPVQCIVKSPNIIFQWLWQPTLILIQAWKPGRSSRMFSDIHFDSSDHMTCNCVQWHSTVGLPGHHAALPGEGGPSQEQHLLQAAWADEPVHSQGTQTWSFLLWMLFAYVALPSSVPQLMDAIWIQKVPYSTPFHVRYLWSACGLTHWCNALVPKTPEEDTVSVFVGLVR